MAAWVFDVYIAVLIISTKKRRFWCYLLFHQEQCFSFFLWCSNHVHMSVHAVSLSSGIAEKLSSNITSGWNSVFMATCLNWVKCSWGASVKYVTQTKTVWETYFATQWIRSQYLQTWAECGRWLLTVIVWILAPVHGWKTGRVSEFQKLFRIFSEENVSSNITSQVDGLHLSWQ